MSEPRFTPGPWYSCHNGDCKCNQIWSNDYPVAVVESGEWGDKYPSLRLVGDNSFNQKAEAYMERIPYGKIEEETARANKALIAASPALYAALEKLVNVCDNCGGPEWEGWGWVRGCLDEAESALAKARGESQ